jgi:hypothetical protein
VQFLPVLVSNGGLRTSGSPFYIVSKVVKDDGVRVRNTAYLENPLSQDFRVVETHGIEGCDYRRLDYRSATAHHVSFL